MNAYEKKSQLPALLNEGEAAAKGAITDAEHKRAATARARLALVGVVLREAEADNGGRRWTVVEGALCRSFDSLGELELWINRRCGQREVVA